MTNEILIYHFFNDVTFLFIKKITQMNLRKKKKKKKSKPFQSILKLHPPILKLHPPSLNTIRTRQGITKVYMQK